MAKTNNMPYKAVIRSICGTPYTVGKAPTLAKAKRIVSSYQRLGRGTPTIFMNGKECAG